MQSYKRNLVEKNTKIVLNYLTVRYFNLDLTTVLLQSDWGNQPSMNLRLNLSF